MDYWGGGGGGGGGQRVCLKLLAGGGLFLRLCCQSKSTISGNIVGFSWRKLFPISVESFFEGLHLDMQTVIKFQGYLCSINA